MSALKKISTKAFEKAYTLRNWEKPSKGLAKQMKTSATIDMGWGRLIFSHTFLKDEDVVEALRSEKSGQRHIAFYTRDPHVLLSLAPQEVFLDPSHTYRLWLSDYDHSDFSPEGFTVSRLETRTQAEGIHAIYLKRHMFPVGPDFIWDQRESDVVIQFVAQDNDTGEILGAITGVDHVRAFDDPENGSSFWCLAVDPQTRRVGVGEMLVRACADYFKQLGRDSLDLSVMHDNRPAIRLYEKLGFQRVPIFCIKRKNPFNEPLFVRNAPEENLNPYAEIITREARRRGIDVQVLDEEGGYFALSFGGRSVVCRESLTEATTAIAMSRCQDKQVTTRLLRHAGLSVPDQREVAEPKENTSFLERHQRIVVKPADGEQGAAVFVDIRTVNDMEEAIAEAGAHSNKVLLEQFVEGDDLRIIVIDDEVVAAAVRCPPEIRGTGQHTIRELIEKLSRRRAAATGGESTIPLDDQTRRTVQSAGLDLDSVLPTDQVLKIRKTANLHTGGTIHDVTSRLNSNLAKAAVQAARALAIPVVGLDFMVPSVEGDDYFIIEANERPGLANHEPQPTAEKFIDFLFPLSTTEIP